MKRKSLALRLLCVAMAIVLVFTSVSVLTASAATTSATFSVFSDIHYLADDLYDYNSAAWAEYLATTGREMEQANAIIDSAFDVSEKYLEEAKANGSAYVLIPGDLTKDGELESHKALAEKFEKFEQETGIPVFVIPGNHDIRNSNAMDYTGDKAVAAEKTEPTDFETIYKDFGYDESDPDCISRFHPEEGNYGGYLSYSWKLNDNFMLIAVDSCKYSADNGSEENEHLTDGMIGDDLMAWIKEQCKYAEDNDLEIVFMQHHNLVQHMAIEEATFFAFVIDDWEYVCDNYADAGIHYVFTGHLHSHDTASYVNDNGERVTDLLTSTLTGYPNELRIAKFTSSADGYTMDMTSHDVDELAPISYERNGETITYDQPFKYTNSYDMTFGDNIENFAAGAVQGLVDSYFPAIQESGGLVNFLKDKGIDLESIIINALGTNGLEIGSAEILTVSQNIMSFINDLGSQIDERYINDPDYTMDYVRTILHKLLTTEVSDQPCTLYYDETGHGNTTGPTTIDDFAQIVLLSYYGGDEDISSDPMVQDVLDSFESGELTEKVFNILRETVVSDLAEDEILSNLYVNLDSLFPKGTVLSILGDVLQGTLNLLLDGDNTYMQLISFVLGIPIVPEKYSSVDNILGTVLLDDYFTQEQYEAWGHTINWMLTSLLTDSNPVPCVDGDYSITYTGPEEVTATVDNYRLPSDVAVTMGEDASTSASFTWLTKYSVTGTDIEIVPYSENPDFSGGSTVKFKADASDTSTSISYPGADLGVLGLLDFDKNYTRHTLTVTGLEPGTEYSYRIGDAQRGWWSDAAKLTTADNSEKTTFLAVAEAGVQNEVQAGVLETTLETAFSTSPEAKFVVSTGDQCVLAKNLKHWRALFNTCAPMLMSTFLMPASGSNEKTAQNLTDHFVLPNVTEQETGVLYSYDYNNIHFIVLNTNDDDDNKLSDEQIEWLKADAQSSGAKWKIVVMNTAIYTDSDEYSSKSVKGIRKQLCALLPALGIDLVLQGSDCVYWRTDAINADFNVSCKEETVTYNGLDYTAKINPKGTVYADQCTAGVRTAGTAADESKVTSVIPNAEASRITDNPMFISITADGDTLYYDAYEVADGSAQRIDSFAIEKTGTSSSGSSASFWSTISKFIDFTLLYRIFGRLWNMILAIVK